MFVLKYEVRGTEKKEEEKTSLNLCAMWKYTFELIPVLICYLNEQFNQGYLTQDITVF